MGGLRSRRTGPWGQGLGGLVILNSPTSTRVHAGTGPRCPPHLVDNQVAVSLLLSRPGCVLRTRIRWWDTESAVFQLLSVLRCVFRRSLAIVISLPGNGGHVLRNMKSCDSAYPPIHFSSGGIGCQTGAWPPPIQPKRRKSYLYLELSPAPTTPTTTAAPIASRAVTRTIIENTN